MTEPTSASPAKAPVHSLLLIGVGFGILTGLMEAAGLMIFQRLNWQRWGPMMHVSEEILWISPIVDVVFFLALSLIIALVSRALKSGNAVRAVVTVLTFAAMYDWTTLTSRIYHRVCLLVALAAAVAIYRRSQSRVSSILAFWKLATPLLLASWIFIFAGIQGLRLLHERVAVARLPRAPADHPNVLVIVIDTLRADRVSSCGYKRNTTPNLDRLASGGVLFENAIATSSWSLPSHVSLITGQYPSAYALQQVQPEPWFGWGRSGLGGYPTIAESFRQSGYRTAAFSANRTYFSKDLGFGRGFIHFEDYFHSPADMFVRTLYGREFARIYLKRSERSLVKRALRKIGFTSVLDQDAEGSGSYGGAFGVRKRAAAINDEVLRWTSRDRQYPFFVFISYFNVHDPYGGPQNYPRTDWGSKNDVDAYDYGVKYTDEYLGRLVEKLENQRPQRSTLVVVTSDHGESLGQHQLQTHGRALYRELIRVPLVFFFPGHIPAGIRITRPVTNAAVSATLLDLLGDDEGVFPNRSLKPLWQNGPSNVDWPAPISELAQNKYPGKHDETADRLIPTATRGAMKSMVTPKWHLIEHQTLGNQLYDWLRDPDELNDVSSSPEGKKLSGELGQALRTQLAH